MNYKKLFLLSALIGLSPNLFAFTNVLPVPATRSGTNKVSPDNDVKRKYNLKGTITGFQKEQSVVFIDGTPYLFKHIKLLQTGQKVHYNVEYSPNEKMGSITRIWK